MSNGNCFTSWWFSATRCGASEHPLLSYLVTSLATLFFVVMGYMSIRCCCLYHQRRRINNINNNSSSNSIDNNLLSQQRQQHQHAYQHHHHYQQAVSELEMEHREIYIPGNVNHLALGAAVFQAHRQLNEHEREQQEQQQQQHRICVIMAGEDSPSCIAQPSPLK